MEILELEQLLLRILCINLDKRKCKMVGDYLKKTLEDN